MKKSIKNVKIDKNVIFYKNHKIDKNQYFDIKISQFFDILDIKISMIVKIWVF